MGDKFADEYEVDSLLDMHAHNAQSGKNVQARKARRLVRRLYGLAINEHRIQAWYQWPPGAPCPPPDADIRVYRHNQLPASDITKLLDQWMGRMPWAMLRNRIMRGKGMLLCVMDDGELGAYTLIGDMSCYHKYRHIAPCGWMIGPCFTSPQKRRRGYYQKMLGHALHCTIGSDGRPAYIFATDTNVVSRRGIERAGFAPLGVYRTTLRFGQLWTSSELLPDQPSTVSGDNS